MRKQTTLFDYLKWRGDIPMSVMPFNKVDGMILSRFVYEPFILEYANEDEQWVKLKDASNRLLQNEKLSDTVQYQEDILLLKAMAETERFGELYVGEFMDIYDHDAEIQFASMAVQLEPELYGIFYRGTDDTVVGWKENMNMVFICPIRSQFLAQDYLMRFAKKHTGKLIVSGHSKGGNLAVYASAFCGEDVQARITDIYNYDGPGFMNEILQSAGYHQICDRIHAFVPQESIVGILLGHSEEHRIIHSHKSNGVLQHNLYSWEIMGADFVYLDSRTNTSTYFDHTMRDWLADMSMEQRESFIEVVYSTIEATNASTIKEFSKHWVKNGAAIFQSYHELDEASKAHISEGVQLFLKSARKNIGRRTRK